MIQPQASLNARILIADDQQADLELLAAILRELGYESLSLSAKPSEASAMQKANAYDLIILGFAEVAPSVAAILKKLKIHGDRLALLAVCSSPQLKKQALESGVMDIINKPIDATEVTARVGNVLEITRLHRQLTASSAHLEQAVLEQTSVLRKEKKRFQRLAELSSDWFWEQDATGKFTEIAGPEYVLPGIADTAEADTPSDIQGPRWDDAQRRELKSKIAARQPFLDFIYGRTNADGSRQYFQLSGEPILGQSGRYEGYRGIGVDVTESVLSARKNDG